MARISYSTVHTFKYTVPAKSLDTPSPSVLCLYFSKLNPNTILILKHLRSNTLVFSQHILAGCNEVAVLSSQSGVVLERLSMSPRQLSGFQRSNSDESSPGLSEEISASVSSTASNPDTDSKHSALSAAWHLQAKSEQASYGLVFFVCLFSFLRSVLIFVTSYRKSSQNTL